VLLRFCVVNVIARFGYFVQEKLMSDEKIFPIVQNAARKWKKYFELGNSYSIETIMIWITNITK
jgi:hypothetical protein